MSALSHTQIVAHITTLAQCVLRVNLHPGQLPQDDYEEEKFRDQVKHSVIQVLRNHKLDIGAIDALSEWPPLLRDADERARLTFIALVLGIYN